MADGGHLKYLKIAISLQMLKLSNKFGRMVFGPTLNPTGK